jgi:hypothetical protein
MQLTSNKPKSIKAALGLATLALLGTDAVAQSVKEKSAAQQSSTKKSPSVRELLDFSAWKLDAAVLFYSEAYRVSAVEAIINGKREFADDHFINLKFTVDTLTGASANGGVAQPNIQTFTRPSGKGSFETPTGETPLDDTFQDTRVQINGQWTQPISDNVTLSSGGHLSKEYDYLSLGINGNLAYDFNQKNTTSSVGFSYFNDTFTPEGAIPTPLTRVPKLVGDSKQSLGDSDAKTTVDVLFGLTQIINRRMITQFNYSYSVVDGYLNDPFKGVSIVDSAGLTQDFIYESRPDKRTKNSVFAQTKYHFDGSIIDLSYRYMWDDWKIKSHTVDSKWRIELNDGYYIEPHVRYYTQTASEFFQPFINQSNGIPEFVSADYRIGEMDTYTLGTKVGMKLSSGNELAFRLEYYHQTPKNAGFEAVGALADVQLYDPIKAVMFQVNYSF